jgi:hypothetical protein
VGSLRWHRLARLTRVGSALPPVHSNVTLAATATVRWLGDHSYSIYLWHWPPIIVLPWAIGHSLGTVDRLGILSGTLLLAYLTKRFVEDPLRSGSWWARRTWLPFSFAALGAAVLVLISWVPIAMQANAAGQDSREAIRLIDSGQPCFGARSIVDSSCKSERFQRPSDSWITFAANDRNQTAGDCQQDVDAPAEPAWCTFGVSTDSRRTIAIVGNSYAVQYIPLLEQYGLTRGWKIRLAARTDCLGLSAHAVAGQLASDPCIEWSKRVQAELIRERPDLVIFVSHEKSSQYLTGGSVARHAAEDAASNVLASLSKFKGLGIPTLIIKHAPGTRPTPAPECVAASSEITDPCAFDRTPVTKLDLLAGTAVEAPKVTQFLSVDEFFCTQDKCHAAIGGVVAYHDDHHISRTYARSLAEFIGPRLDSMIRRSDN